MKVIVLGGVQQYGQHCFYIEGEKHAIMFDCGIEHCVPPTYPSFELVNFEKLKSVLITHIHEDHSAAIPLLYKNGYSGEIWMTEETAFALPDVLENWIEKQNKKQALVPYEIEDVFDIRIRNLFIQEWVEIDEDLRWCAIQSGHVLGGVSYIIEMEGKRIFYSGDYSSDSLVLEAKLPPNVTYDLAILDSGHCTLSDQTINFENLKKEILRHSFNYLPVPLYGRSIDLLTFISEKVDVPLFVDERLRFVLKQYEKAVHYIKPTWSARSIWARVTWIDMKKHSMREAGVYIAVDAKLEQKYYEKNPALTILVTGYNAPRSNTNATIYIPFKVHPNEQDIRKLLNYLQAKKNVLFHSEPEEFQICYQSLSNDYPIETSLTFEI